MELREELPGDKESVRTIHLRAFGDRGLVVANLVDTLRETITPKDGLSLVAGHMPDYQKRGIGSALVRKGLKALAQRAVPLVFLEGDPGYYSRFGFTPGGDLGFRKPSLRIPDGAFQAIRLREYESWMTGTLVYAEPFWRHDSVGLRDPSA